MMRAMIRGLVCAAATMSMAAVAQTASPNAPAPQAGVRRQASPFPAVNPKNFTATSPTVDEVNSFLKALWGYDEGREWQVEAILKTPAPGVSKVVVVIANRAQPGKELRSVFFTTPDGKHAIADGVMDFGAKPFEANRKLLQERADGPARGAKGNELMLVEFADLQCARCQEAQDKMDNLVQDFPQARIVYEDVPQAGHPFSERAAVVGACVRKLKGDAAFFAYVQAVYAKQAGLTKESAEATLKASVSAAAADPAAVEACAATPEAKSSVEAAAKLADEIGVAQTPMLAVNGHMMPLDAVPYETLKQIVAFQAGQDGITVHLQPTLSTLK